MVLSSTRMATAKFRVACRRQSSFLDVCTWKMHSLFLQVTRCLRSIGFEIQNPTKAEEENGNLTEVQTLAIIPNGEWY